MQLAYKLNLKYREGFIKNRYIGRTFIMPGQTIRKKIRSLQTLGDRFRIQRKKRSSGRPILSFGGRPQKKSFVWHEMQEQKKVYFASAAPPVRYPNVYGIDMPTRKELVAYGATEDEVGKIIGADRIFYQDLSDLVLSAKEGNPAITDFDTSCFDGKYITGDR
jgi:amidophosphoribosyltransferase